MNKEIPLSLMTASVTMQLSPDIHIKLIHLAGERNWRYVRMASLLLTNAITKTRSIAGKDINDQPYNSHDSTVTVPVTIDTKIALIGLVGNERLAYTSVASALLRNAVNEALGQRNDAAAQAVRAR